MEKLEKVLNENFKVLNSYEKLKKQVMSRTIKFSPIHSDTFQSENSKLCEENDFEIIKELVKILKDPDESKKAVACYDIGQFSRYHPFGKQIADKLGAKSLIMELMKSTNVQIRENAHVAVQKLLITDWQKFAK